jgi:hypothetical protein
MSTSSPFPRQRAAGREGACPVEEGAPVRAPSWRFNILVYSSLLMDGNTDAGEPQSSI